MLIYYVPTFNLIGCKTQFTRKVIQLFFDSYFFRTNNYGKHI